MGIFLLGIGGFAFLFVGFAGWAAVFFLCVRLFPWHARPLGEAPAYRHVFAWGVYMAAMLGWPVLYITACVAAAHGLGLVQ